MAILSSVSSTLFLAILLVCFVKAEETQDQNNLQVLTVASHETDGFNRLLRSAKIYGLDVKVLGLNQKWEGGDMKSTGGGQKVNLLKEELEKYKDDKSKIIMFIDGYDVIIIADSDKIVNRFKKTQAKILFSAEGFCWPDTSLSDKYPRVDKGKRFLNSGGFIGYAPELYQMVTSREVSNQEDDQLFYTKVYLDENVRKMWDIKLDHKAEIFQNLHGAVGDAELRFRDDESYLYNTAYGTTPLVVHGNGPSKVALNSLGNYLAKSWTLSEGCLSCKEDTISLDDKKVDDYPRVVIGLFLEKPTPFLEDFLERIADQIYPKDKIDLYIHNKAEYHVEHVNAFLTKYKARYNSVKTVVPEDNVKEWRARNLGLEECVKRNCDYYFSVDSDAMITNPQTLRLLIEQNRPVLSPMLVRPFKVWSNFWGALTPEGFYARSNDYMEIVHNNRRGVWNVPYISASYLIHGSLIKNKESAPSFIRDLLDPDMAFCVNLREKAIFMHVTNRDDFGHLLTTETFTTEYVHNDMYQIADNKLDWERRYIHENYSQALDPKVTVAQPCPDVYWFPVVTEKFTNDLIDMMENFGQWSDGSNYDPRLDGGYENVPTRDIHMNQVGFEQQWLYFLREYIRPVQERVFTGYFHDPPQAQMNFVVRYRPNEQPALRPHHDSSTYTVNLALNRPGTDYEGGGCRFVRYNCDVTQTKVGWAMIHPGRLTHYHEGLPTTKGTRYIMVSFVDP